MTYSRESVYSYVRTAIVTAHSGAYVTARREPVSKTFPAVRLSEVNRIRTQAYATLANDDQQYVSTFEAEIFCNEQNGALATAYSVLDTVESAFKTLGYFETFCEPIDNFDPSVFRVVARFSRQIGMADVIPSTT